MIARLALLLLVTTAGGMASPAAADESVRDWLNRMEHAVASISYRGTMVSVREGQLDTLAVYHRVEEQGVRERIVALNGPPREIIRNHDSVQRLATGDVPMVVDNAFPARVLPRIAFDALEGEDALYRGPDGRGARVAGRDARVIEIMPRDGFRYGRKLWLDERTAMLLRTSLLDADGRVLQDLSFVELELGAMVLDEELQPQLIRPSRVTRYRDADAGDGRSLATGQNPSWMPETLPDGFRLVSVGRPLGRDEQGFEHLLFSDGLSVSRSTSSPFAGGRSRAARCCRFDERLHRTVGRPPGDRGRRSACAHGPVDRPARPPGADAGTPPLPLNVSPRLHLVMSASPPMQDLLWQPARIVEDDDGRRWLEFESLSECARCRAGSGCGASQWARMFGSGPVRRMPLPSDCDLPNGTPVRAGLPATALVRAAGRVYLLPLLVFIAALAGQERLAVPEPLALLLALAAAAGLLLWTRARDRARAPDERRTPARGLRPVIEPRADACAGLESRPG